MTARRLRRPKRPPFSAAALELIERRSIFRNGLRDFYFSLMKIPLPALLAFLATAFLAANLVFAGIYCLTGGLEGVGHPGFARALFFSIHTISTTGYGSVYPVSTAANIVGSVEIFFGMLGNALTTGVLFARLSRPRARVMFSNVVVIRDYHGAPTLMFRMINERHNQIAEAHISVTVTHDEDDGYGSVIWGMRRLDLVRDTSPVFALGWMVMHTITERSPFYGKTAEEIAASGHVMICVMSGMDDTLNATVVARHVYGAENFRFGRRFAEVIKMAPDGQLAVDYDRFHETLPA